MSDGGSYWVYILASDIGGTLYVGVTNDLIRRVGEHRTHSVEGFTRKHTVDRLVHFEPFGQIEDAIHRDETTEEMEAGMEDRVD